MNVEVFGVMAHPKSSAEVDQMVDYRRIFHVTFHVKDELEVSYILFLTSVGIDVVRGRRTGYFLTASLTQFELIDLKDDLFKFIHETIQTRFKVWSLE